MGKQTDVFTVSQTDMQIDSQTCRKTYTDIHSYKHINRHTALLKERQLDTDAYG